MLKRFKVIILIVYSLNLNAQEVIPPSDIKWYSLNEAFELSKKSPRPILLDVYTDWCSWCKHMMKTTFANKGLANYINNNFYAAKFNAETLDTIEFKGKEYVNRQIGRRSANDLAIKLLDGRLTYPSLVYFDRNGQKMVVPGYKEAKDLEPFLVYYAENLSTTANINDFIINYMYSFPKAFEKDHSIFKIEQNLRPDTNGVINWLKPEQIGKQGKKKKRPVIMYLYTDWCISCKVMEKTSFGDRELAKQLNENYYAIKIDAAQAQEIEFMGQSYKGTTNKQPHEIAHKFLNKNFKMPAIVIFDEELNFVTSINGYLMKNHLIPLSEYFLKKEYKKQSFQDYVKLSMEKKKEEGIENKPEDQK